MEVLGRVAAALNVPPTVVELKIFEWKVMLPRGCGIMLRSLCHAQCCSIKEGCIPCAGFGKSRLSNTMRSSRQGHHVHSSCQMERAQDCTP